MFRRIVRKDISILRNVGNYSPNDMESLPRRFEDYGPRTTGGPPGGEV
jgi:hypothetical protein